MSILGGPLLEDADIEDFAWVVSLRSWKGLVLLFEASMGVRSLGFRGYFNL